MFSHLAFLDLDMTDLLIILAVALLLFGGKKLPEISKNIGESVRELRKEISSTENENNKTEENLQPESD